MALKSDASAVTVHLETPAHWEARCRNRVREAGRDPILERSHQIVDAACELLEEEGLDALTVRAVLVRTGLSRRAFYECFSGKDAVVLAVFEQIIRSAARHFSDQLQALPDPIERLRLIVTCLVLGRSSLDEVVTASGSRRGSAMSREHLRLAESHPADLHAALSSLIALIAQQLSDGMAVGMVRSCAPARLAMLVYNLVSTTLHTELLVQGTAEPDRVGRAQLATDIWEFCRRAIAP